jgi:hypothetical protein
MEKVIYALWPRDGEDRDVMNARLRDHVGPALTAMKNVRAVRLNLQDEAVARAEPLRLTCPGGEQPVAAVQLWLDVAHDAQRAPIDAALRETAGRIAAWSVMSSTVIANAAHPPLEGERTGGWSQLCFLKRPGQLDPEAWRHNWQVLHTPVAVETQGNFEYVQNLVVRSLIAGPQQYAAIVEECFPAEAMDDPHVFFNAVGDPERFAANTSGMAASCARFIGEGDVDLLPTSQYDLKPLRRD